MSTRATAVNWRTTSPTRIARGDLYFLARFEILRQAFEIEDFQAREAERFRAFAGHKFERQDAHADQVAAVNALEAFGQHHADAEQDRALGGPVAR